MVKSIISVVWKLELWSNQSSVVWKLDSFGQVNHHSGLETGALARGLERAAMLPERRGGSLRSVRSTQDVKDTQGLEVHVTRERQELENLFQGPVL